MCGLFFWREYVKWHYKDLEQPVLSVDALTTRRSLICGLKNSVIYTNLKLERSALARDGSFHRLPIEDEAKRNWLKNLNLKKPPKTLYVCSFHFVEKKPTEDNPYPTLFLGYEKPPEKRRRLLRRDDSSFSTGKFIHQALTLHKFQRLTGKHD